MSSSSISSSPESSPKRPPRYGVARPLAGQKRSRGKALELPPRKRPTHADPLVHHGRHFGRAVFAFANMHALISAGLSLDEDEAPDTQQGRREARVFDMLLKMVPGLEDRLYSEDVDESDVLEIATLLQKGASSSRSDDTKSLKGVVIDWITPNGESLRPPIARNIKTERGFNHPRTGFLLCPRGWIGTILRLLPQQAPDLSGGRSLLSPLSILKSNISPGFKHIFTSPSSVDDDPKATRSGNARLHGMSSVTKASIAYVATQIRFALSSAGIFCRTDKETDSETFYTSLLELFEDPEEQDEVKDLLTWWNKQIFPSFSTFRRVIPADSVLSKMKARRAALKALDMNKGKGRSVDEEDSGDS
ncbi:hypothetical protein NMY22_g9167 [Coprinellus aureogranulatus]|nr:hypothetical protein NMY22_g9167 [Coprinellus aureogranulatus]